MTSVTPVLPPNVILGVTHLLVDGQYTGLLKCPFCNFLHNIHVDVIKQHIQIDHPGKSYSVSDFYPTIIRHTSSYGPYASKEAIKHPWIRCLFCRYRDKIEFDLSLHILEEHKQKILQLEISYEEHSRLLHSDPFAKFYGRLEYRLDKAVEIAKRRGQVDRAVEAVRKKSGGNFSWQY